MCKKGDNLQRSRIEIEEDEQDKASTLNVSLDHMKAPVEERILGRERHTHHLVLPFPPYFPSLLPLLV